jgi:hypothetical protein
VNRHIEYGDAGTETAAEILPHPWCDFCEKYFFNDTGFFDHLGREHLTCHLCDDCYKNVYYNNYLNLENHFASSHFLCPYPQCKDKCYIAFRTEDELQAHADMQHSVAKHVKTTANSLLAFDYNDENNEPKHDKRKKREQKP